MKTKALRDTIYISFTGDGTQQMAEQNVVSHNTQSMVETKANSPAKSTVQSSAKESTSAGPASTRDAGFVERRRGVSDRRMAHHDRRNEDRVNEDLLPRRNPDVPDRRVSAA